MDLQAIGEILKPGQLVPDQGNGISMFKSYEKTGEYQCPICGTKGYVEETRGDYVVAVRCKCYPVRKSMKLIKQSGLLNLLDEYTFEKYIADQPWQIAIKAKAMRFLIDCQGKWFGCFGQVGSGKTHICTAICGEFLKSGIAVKYMPWRDEIMKLKACIMDDEVYSEAISSLKHTQVLYIDDFFKTEQGKNPTTADINIAFEILNYRYNNKDLITILSCERQYENLMDIDEAVGSRIYQRCKEYAIEIDYGQSKNYRLKA